MLGVLTFLKKSYSEMLFRILGIYFYSIFMLKKDIYFDENIDVTYIYIQESEIKLIKIITVSILAINIEKLYNW